MWGNLTKMREFFKKIDLETLAGAEGKNALAPEFLEFAPLRAPVLWSALRSALPDPKVFGANSTPKICFRKISRKIFKKRDKNG